MLRLGVCPAFAEPLTNNSNRRPLLERFTKACMSRRPARAVQLQLDFASQPQLLSSEDLRKALARRGCRRLVHIRFKKNRGRIVSLSRDGQTLHIHACFQEATDDAMNAVVTFLKAGRRSYAYREA